MFVKRVATKSTMFLNSQLIVRGGHGRREEHLFLRAPMFVPQDHVKSCPRCPLLSFHIILLSSWFSDLGEDRLFQLEIKYWLENTSCSGFSLRRNAHAFRCKAFAFPIPSSLGCRRPSYLLCSASVWCADKPWAGEYATVTRSTTIGRIFPTP